MALDLVELVTATGALGTAAYGIVDTTKLLAGGISNAGFAYVLKELEPFDGILNTGDKSSAAYRTIRANWLNGMAKPDQKSTTKSLIRLAITQDAVDGIAKALGIAKPDDLKAGVGKMVAAQSLSAAQTDAMGRLDAAIDARLDAGYERAEQFYRNSAKMLAAAVSVVLALVAGTQIDLDGATAYGVGDVVISVLVGLLAVPLAPVAKDLASALGTAVHAIKATKG